MYDIWRKWSQDVILPLRQTLFFAVVLFIISFSLSLSLPLLHQLLSVKSCCCYFLASLFILAVPWNAPLTAPLSAFLSMSIFPVPLLHSLRSCICCGRIELHLLDPFSSCKFINECWSEQKKIVFSVAVYFHLCISFSKSHNAKLLHNVCGVCSFTAPETLSPTFALLSLSVCLSLFLTPTLFPALPLAAPIIKIILCRQHYTEHRLEHFQK